MQSGAAGLGPSATTGVVGNSVLGAPLRGDLLCGAPVSSEINFIPYSRLASCGLTVSPSMDTLAEHLAHCGCLVNALLPSFPLHCQTDTKEGVKGCMAYLFCGRRQLLASRLGHFTAGHPSPLSGVLYHRIFWKKRKHLTSRDCKEQ